MLAHRARAWLSSIPLPRLRRIILVLFIATAAFDSAGKTLVSYPRFNRALSKRVRGAAAADVRNAAKPSGNFEIFRLASRHLVSGEDMYADYPTEISDRFKYSPTFALLFAPLAWLAWPVALFLWSCLNALVLFVAVERVLPGRAGLLALGALLLELLRGMQNAQSNALVAGLIVLAFVAMERTNAWRTAAAVMIGACVKIFPLAALSFAIPRRRVWRTGLWAAAIGATLVALPLVVTSPTTLRAQYASWRGVEGTDAQQRWFSVMQLVHRWTGASWPNWPIQLLGTLVLLAPLALRRDRWDDARYRFAYLCSVLMFVVLFNHQAERASYLIAFVGITLWYVASERARWQSWLFVTTFITIPMMSTLIPGTFFRGRNAMLYRLAAPTLAIWLAVQWELWRGAPAVDRPVAES
ncbi:hypothetical protein BH11GEM2_BH11GEM2_29710 [soil metagenome]